MAFVVVLASVVAWTPPAAAQPFVWSSWSGRVQIGGPQVQRLAVFNLSSMSDQTFFPVPAGVGAGTGVLTPDGRYFLLPTTVGLARFLTNPPALDRLIAPGVSIEALTVEPAGARAHATGPFGHAVVDWETGAVLSVTCCSKPAILFSPDGNTSVYFEVIGPVNAASTRITAFAEPAHTTSWTRTIPGRVGARALGNTHVAISTLQAVTVLRNTDGAELGPLGDFASSLAWRDTTLLVTRSGAVRHQLLAYDVPAGEERVLLELAPTRGGPGEVFVSANREMAYWFQQDSELGGSSWITVHALDLNTNTVSVSGQLPRFRSGFAVEDAALCGLSIPTVPASVPPEGGLIGIPVVAGGDCRPWTAPGALNPGPHVGPATIFFNAAPNTEAVPMPRHWLLLGRTIAVTQPPAAPAAPELAFDVSQDRATLTWVPARGGGVTSWIVRGATAGSAMTDIATVDASQRSWQSPTLPPGSYEVEVLAANLVGRSPGSNRARFSVGIGAVPGPPENLSATVVDQHVSLRWESALTGPAASSYVIDAAPGGSAAFAAVTTTQMPSAIVPSAPLGGWRVRVRARTAGGTGEPSAPVELTTTACTTAPAPPQSVWLLPTYPTTTIRWSPPAQGAAVQYVLEVGSTLGGADVGRLVLPGTTHAYTAQISSTVFVQVKARSGCGESLPSNSVVWTPF